MDIRARGFDIKRQIKICRFFVPYRITNKLALGEQVFAIARRAQIASLTAPY